MANGTLVRRRSVDSHTCYIELLLNDEVVSNLRVFHRSLRIGSVIASFGGIGYVETDEAFRRRGFARQILDEANRYLGEAGLDLGLLFGIQDFYQRWGYAPAIPEYEVTIETAALTDASLGMRAVAATGAHRSDVRDLYNRLNGTRSCSVVRHEDTWPFAHPEDDERGDFGVRGCFDAHVLLDHSGAVRGYVCVDVDERFDIGPVRVSEIGCAGSDAFESLAALIAGIAKDRERDAVTVFAPPDEPFIEYLRRFGSQVLAAYSKSGGGMLRIMSLERLFEKLAPELSDRLRRSPLAGWGGRLILETDIGTVPLDIQACRVEVDTSGPEASRHVVTIPQHKLIQSITGFRDIATLALDDDVRCPSDALPVLRALFPQGYPHMWHDDRF